MNFATYLKCCGATALMLAAPVVGAAQPTARGLYMNGARLGVSAEIEVERNGKREIVPSNWQFKTGDRFWIHLTLNQDSYIYVLNRTLAGGPEQVSRGIKLMAQEDKKAAIQPADTYTMVFPPPQTAAQLVKKGVRTSIPGSGQFFEMDQTLGAEKVIIVASPTPTEIAKWFDASTGKLAPSAKTNDSSESVLNRLNSELSQMADNTETEGPPKTRELAYAAGEGSGSAAAPKITPTPTPKAPSRVRPATPPSNSIGVVRKPGKPMMMELTMMHQN